MSLSTRLGSSSYLKLTFSKTRSPFTSSFGAVIACVQGFPVFPDDIQNAPKGNHTGGGLYDQATQVADRPDQPDHQAGIRQIRADGQLSIDDHQGAGYKAAQHLEGADNVGYRPEKGVQLH